MLGYIKNTHYSYHWLQELMFVVCTEQCWFFLSHQHVLVLVHTICLSCRTSQIHIPLLYVIPASSTQMPSESSVQNDKRIFLIRWMWLWSNYARPHFTTPNPGLSLPYPEQRAITRQITWVEPHFSVASRTALDHVVLAWVWLASWVHSWSRPQR